MLGACSFAKCFAVRWNVCNLYDVRHTVRTSGLPVHPGYIRGRGTDLMYPLGGVPTRVRRGSGINSNEVPLADYEWVK